MPWQLRHVHDGALCMLADMLSSQASCSLTGINLLIGMITYDLMHRLEILRCTLVVLYLAHSCNHINRKVCLELTDTSLVCLQFSGHFDIHDAEMTNNM